MRKEAPFIFFFWGAPGGTPGNPPQRPEGGGPPGGGKGEPGGGPFEGAKPEQKNSPFPRPGPAKSQPAKKSLQIFEPKRDPFPLHLVPLAGRPKVLGKLGLHCVAAVHRASSRKGVSNAERAVEKTFCAGAIRIAFKAARPRTSRDLTVPRSRLASLPRPRR